MTEQNPADRPGHLDIDAVSAFVDRDLGPDDLATIAIHLHVCPACHREVVEIRTTVVLLAGLPQYTPRRSFCLGHEHGRAARRRGRVQRDRAWPGPPGSPNYPASAAVAARSETGRGAGWLPGLQAAAMVIGALLLLVTSSDLMGMPPQPAAWLAEPDAPAPRMASFSAPGAETAVPAPAPTLAVAGDAVLEPAASENESSFGDAAIESGGTASDDSASEEVLTDQDLARIAPSSATSAALTAVTQAVPTPAADAETAVATDAPAPSGSEPSRLRLVQLGLAFALVWLIVSIVGLRWVRGLRRAPG